MRSKNILSTAAFVLAFAFSTAFASLFITETQIRMDLVPAVNESKPTSCFFRNKSAATADKIAALINQDKRNGLESDRYEYEINEDATSPFQSELFPAYAGAVEQYADESGSMKTRGLPSDFQIAWREHMKAWRDYSDFLNRMKTASNRAAWSSEDFEDADAAYNREISRTWTTVLEIGESYGADVSE